MPIIIKEFTWTQTDHHIVLTVPLPAANRKPAGTVDIFVQPQFVKVHSPPHLFELYLAHDVDIRSEAHGQLDGSGARIHDNAVVFRLRKAAATAGCQWSAVARNLSKAETVAVKQEILQQAHQLAAEETRRRAQLEHDRRQAEIHREIEREAAIRDSVEAMHRRACGREMRALEVGLNAEASPPFAKSVAVDSRRQAASAMKSKQAVIPKQQASSSSVVVKRAPPPAIPTVRQSGTIGVAFSERRFPTPQRESQEGAEQEWLCKQNEARRATGFVEEDLRPEERNVDWLKAKAGDFYAKRNYLGAISAYTTAIRMNPQCHDLYANRASCQYAMGNYNRCITDASAALDLMQPACPSNARLRCQCLVKRGAALCKLGHLRQGRDELRAALYLQPDDVDLRRDLRAVDEAIEAQDDED